ncbi:MAG TPA: hypothetical protein VEO20_00895 [Thermoplasmata archaeon]|nr:hypothetical protein [Thermoplasmata archaeon]
MTDPLGVGSFFASMMTWLESRKQRKLLEKITQSPPVIVKPRRRRARSRAVSTAAAATRAAAEERRRQKVQLERDKHEWRKNRDIAKALGWILERMSEDE